jgi:hypothetical protein
MGVAEFKESRRLKVGVFSTGKEIASHSSSSSAVDVAEDFQVRHEKAAFSLSVLQGLEDGFWALGVCRATILTSLLRFIGRMSLRKRLTW